MSVPVPSQQNFANSTLLRVTVALILTLLIGVVLYVGQSLILPIVIALIFVYIIASLDKALANAPLVRSLPQWLRRIALYVIFLAVFAGMVALITSTIQQLVHQAPGYQNNISTMINDLASLLRIEKLPDWETMRELMFKKIDFKFWFSSAASQLSSAGGTLLIITVYVFFLAAERSQFDSKLALAFPDPERAARTKSFIDQINNAVGNYLGTKTLVNVILGAISYVIMWGFGLDYAAFWAVLIAILNYIPYIGSIIAVLLPVMLSIVQFASWPMTLALFAMLQILQLIIGYGVEPKMVGKTANLSAFVVLVALSFWSMVWGMTGAILAVPLTNIIVIICLEIPSLRPLAIMMSEEPRSLRKQMIQAPASTPTQSQA